MLVPGATLQLQRVTAHGCIPPAIDPEACLQYLYTQAGMPWCAQPLPEKNVVLEVLPKTGPDFVKPD